VTLLNAFSIVYILCKTHTKSTNLGFLYLISLVWCAYGWLSLLFLYC